MVQKHPKKNGQRLSVGYSRYREWVQGYAFHLLCLATPGFVLVPLNADALTAKKPENGLFESIIDHICDDTKYIVEDSHADARMLTDNYNLINNGNYITLRLIMLKEKYKHTASRHLSYT